MSQEKSDKAFICPNCQTNEALIRIKRTFLQRLISIAIPVQRFECYYCGWQGVVRKVKVEAGQHKDQIAAESEEKEKLLEGQR